MTTPPPAATVAQAIAQVMRDDRGRCLAMLTARIGNLTRAEDALQEAAASALIHWGRSGVPDVPRAWLVKVALRKEIDRLRAAGRAQRNQADIALLAEEEAAETDPDLIPDERLRLIFTCCHPALEPKSRVALTLRTLCGLTTDEIAALYLDASPTMGQRLSRAKAKIAGAGIPFAVPGPDAWPDRLQSVLDVVYLIYTLAHQAPDDRDLGGEAIYLARLLNQLRPGDAEIEGALALLLLTEARRPARMRDGVMVPLGQQDRSQWDSAMVAEGTRALDAALTRRAPGPFQIKAAIAALHCDAGPTDWAQIVMLYNALLRHEPTDVVRLNLAVAVAESGAPDAALALVDALALDGYQPFHATRAALRARLDRPGAADDYARAISLSRNASERNWLTDQAKKNAGHKGPAKSNREV